MVYLSDIMTDFPKPKGKRKSPFGIVINNNYASGPGKVPLDSTHWNPVWLV